MKRLLPVLLSFGLVGCVGMQTKILSLQNGASEDIVIKRIGKPLNEQEVSYNLIRLVYNAGFLSQYPQYWVYLKSHRYVYARLHEIFGIYDQLKDLNHLGMISDEDYQSQADDLRQRALRAFILYHRYYQSESIQFYHKSTDQVLSQQNHQSVSPASCRGYSGPGGPCYTGPGGGLYTGPGGGAYTGPGGGAYTGPGGGAYTRYTRMLWFE